MSESGSKCYDDAASACRWYLKPSDVNVANFNELTPRKLAGKIVIKWAECRTVDAKGKCTDEKAKKGLIARDLASTERYVHMPKARLCKPHEGDCSAVLADTVWQVTSTHKPFAYQKPINVGVVKSTQRQFVRVFPNPFDPAKVKSGNYPPTGSWLNGAQMVAMNTQKQDRYWHVHHAMFRDSAFRLKPEWMRAATVTAPSQAKLFIKTTDTSLTLFHPSSETSTGIKTDNGEALFDRVYKDACVLYCESSDGYSGAVEIAPDATSGVATLMLYKWKRPLKSGIKYMGPKCNYSVAAEKTVPLQFLWSQ